MSDCPIIFSAPMIRALLDGRKTMTRRLAWRGGPAVDGGLVVIAEVKPTIWQRVRPGDRLWAREVFAKRQDCADGTAKARQYLQFKADENDLQVAWHDYGRGWRSPIHMPRWASRITLLVTAARIERVQEISEEDARAEGVERDTEQCDHVRYGCDKVGCLGKTYKSSFCELWSSLHGSGSWDANPEVVALTFAVHRRNIDAMVTP